MKKILACFLLVSSGLLATAQTADDIIDKYIDAIGGADKVKTVTSVYSESVTIGPNNMEITGKTYRVQDKLYRQDTDFGMGSFSMIITDKEGWFSNPRNQGAFEAIPADRLKAQGHELECISPLVGYSAKGHKAELIGKETIDGVEAYNIKLTLKSGQAINYFIDNKNWYVIRTSMKAAGGGPFGGGGGGNQEIEMKTDFADYKKTSEGIAFPMTLKRPGFGGNVMETTIEKVEINKPVNAKLYKPE